jgi:hypothetical protein
MKTTFCLIETFSLPEAASIVLVKPKLLHKWVESGRIVPAVLGSKGRGNSHRFSAQQLLGIAAAASLIRSTGASVEYTKEVLRLFGDMSDDALDHWLSADKHSDRTEEAFGVWKTAPILQDLGNPPADEDAIRDLVGRMERAEHAIKARRGIGRGLSIQRGVFVCNEAKNQPRKRR